MEPGENKSAGAVAPGVVEPLAWVTALATAFKNIAIYPATHPRVEGAAKDFIARLAKAGSRHVWHVLCLRGADFQLGGVTLPADGAGVAWLSQRFREAGLRGVEFADDCNVPDILRFAGVLNQSRARTGATFESLWQQDEARIRPLPLVFDGQHLDGGVTPADAEHAGAGDELGDGGQANAGSGVVSLHSPRLASLMRHVTATPEVQERLRAIERNSAGTDERDRREVDLMAAIAELLPADVSSNREQIADAVNEILGRVESELAELVRRNGKVKGADMMRLALGVARKYFHTETPEQTLRRDLPSGRPEDARIVADLDLLLAELEALPDDTGLRLPAADQLDAKAPAMAQELLGIYLHMLSNHDTPATAAALEAPLTQLLTANGTSLRPLLDSYIKPKQGEAPLGNAGQLRLIKILVDAGLATLAREQDYVNAESLTRGFPEALPLAARVLGTDSAGLAILRKGLEALAPVLAIGGVDAASSSGALADPTVIAALVAIGGNVVLPLLVAAAANNSLLVRKVLLDYARTLPLPKAEAAVCRALTDIELVPREYVQNLLVAASQKRLDTTLRTASGQLLRLAIVTGEGRLEPAAMLKAIDDLQHVPGAETSALLRRLAMAGRFTRFSTHARAVRRHARQTLAAISSQGTP